MSQNYEKLKAKLLELFMLDQPDLDFGIYRIMNSKRTEITQFLDNDLLPQVKSAFAQYSSNDHEQIKQELAKAIEKTKDLGINPDDSPKVQELKQKLSQTTDLTAMENEVYSDLFNFFRRYYKEGDFLSLRRYKKGVYAIPYEGEEVKLYWANHDQYYIKTSEYLRDYAFLLPSGKKVHFKLTEADIEKDNRKTDPNKERRFSLIEENPVVEENQELIIRFHYLPCDKKTKQKDLNDHAVKTILETNNLDTWITALSAKMPTEKNPDRTLLEKHLNDYTSRHSFDYFIHKDLGGFLQRELDFYIKNEIMHLDDIESQTAPKVEQYLSKIKVIRTIAHKIISFLEQLENFQKKLWLKKKFVVETNYCVTLDRVPKELYPEIAANNAQREEWVRLFAIDQIKADLAVKESYSSPLSEAFLTENPYLVLDTRFFDETFKNKLLSSIENIDEQLNGLLIHSENFQALNLILDRYKEQVKCIYIDPPYNTGDDGFAYKDNYKSSSWLSMLGQTSSLAISLLDDKSSYFISCDENEALDLGQLLVQYFGQENHVETITWNKRVPKNDKGIGNIHEYIYLFTKNQKLRRSQEMSFVMRKDGLEEIYELIRKAKQKKVSLEETKKRLKKFYKKQGYDRGITLYCDLDPNYEVWGKINMAWPNPKTQGPRYEVINPITNKPTPIPKKGWRWMEETFRKAEKGPVFSLPDGSMMKGRIWYPSDEKTQPSSITYLRDVESFLLRSIISLKSNGSLELEQLGLDGLIDYPKPSKLMEWIFFSTGEREGFLMDYFAGSGTTGQAIINLNREDNSNLKFILAEMGQYFDTVLKPRIQKVIYSTDWKNGKPVSRDTGISHMFKYIRLESYEDCLNNLILKQTEQQKQLLQSNQKFRETYMLGYMLETETKSSSSLLNLDAFTDPFNYTLNIATGSVGETTPVTVDMVETFNYLLGLKVRHIDTIEDYRVIEGHNPKDEKVLIIWRNTQQKSNENLDKFFTRQQYNTLDMEYDLIYVNGDNNLENLKKEQDTWKVRLIEEEFHRLMFDVQDV